MVCLRVERLLMHGNLGYCLVKYSKTWVLCKSTPPNAMY